MSRLFFIILQKKNWQWLVFHGLKLVQWVTFFAVFLLYFGMLMEPKILKSDITQRVFVMLFFLCLQVKLWYNCLLWWITIKGAINKKLTMAKVSEGGGGGGRRRWTRVKIEEMELSRTLWEFSGVPKTC